MARTTTSVRTRRAAPKAAADAPTWDELAALLPIDIRRLYRLRLEPGAPTTRDIDAWRTFIAAREAAGAGAEPAKSAAQLEREQCDLRYARARAEQAERDNAVHAGRLVPRAEAEAALVLLRDTITNEFAALHVAVSTLLPDQAKPERDAIEDAVKRAVHAAWTRLSSEKAG